MNKAYGLKTVSKDLTSYNGFKWKKKGIVKCNDWNNRQECGGGLHFALNGEGDGTLFNWSPDAVWIVAEFDKDKIIDLQGKVKVETCNVLYAGDRKTACDIIYNLCGKVACIGGQSTSGYKGKSISGDYGQSTSGYQGKSISGDNGQSVGRYANMLTSGRFGACVNYGHYCTWTATPETVLILHWEQDNRLQTLILYGNDFKDEEIITINGGKIIRGN